MLDDGTISLHAISGAFSRSMNFPFDFASSRDEQGFLLTGADTGELKALLAELGAAWNPVVLRAHPRLKGWAGLDLPRELGGSSWCALQMVRVFRGCGRHDVELRDLPGAGHARLLHLVQSQRFDTVLSAVAEGRYYCAIAITEPDVGSDMQAMKTTATPAEGGYRLNGAKEYIARMAESTHVIVFARVARPTEPPLISAFLIPKDAPGVAVEALSPMGLCNVSWARVTLLEVQVPLSTRIGGEGQGMSLFRRHFCYWRTMMAAVAIGSAQAVVDQTTRRMKTRLAFGGPIGRFSHLQQALARHVAQLRMASLLVDRVAADIDAHRWPVFDAAMAKAEAVEAAIAATEWGMSTFGAAGYEVACGLEKRYRDLLGLRIADGTTDLLRGQVARAFLGEQLYALSLNRVARRGFGSDDQQRQFWDA
jgi:alkylation response protein AidB-like acyl-CoA dehydrogenase